MVRGEGLVWLIGAMVCLLAAPWVQWSVSTGNGWSHNALQHHWLMPISCHFRDCKALLVTSLTRVSGAITSVQTFIFTFNHHELITIYSQPSRRVVGQLQVWTSTCCRWHCLHTNLMGKLLSTVNATLSGTYMAERRRMHCNYWQMFPLNSRRQIEHRVPVC